jgi:hypothetical protein
MSLDIDTQQLESALQDLSRDEAEELARRWYSASQEILFQYGDELEWDVKDVARLAFPPKWDDSAGAFVFTYNHEAARYLNDGTAPHEIEPKQGDSLVFEWEDAPPEVQDMFEETFPTVFLPKVDHPGTPAIRFIERGEQKAVQQWERGR